MKKEKRRIFLTAMCIRYIPGGGNSYKTEVGQLLPTHLIQPRCASRGAAIDRVYARNTVARKPTGPAVAPADGGHFRPLSCLVFVHFCKGCASQTGR